VARVVIDGLSVSNAGWKWVPVEQVCGVKGGWWAGEKGSEG
jgi:hypothetical protein